MQTPTRWRASSIPRRPDALWRAAYRRARCGASETTDVPLRPSDLQTASGRWRTEPGISDPGGDLLLDILTCRPTLLRTDRCAANRWPQPQGGEHRRKITVARALVESRRLPKVADSRAARCVGALGVPVPSGQMALFIAVTPGLTTESAQSDIDDSARSDARSATDRYCRLTCCLMLVVRPAVSSIPAGPGRAQRGGPRRPGTRLEIISVLTGITTWRGRNDRCSQAGD